MSEISEVGEGQPAYPELDKKLPELRVKANNILVRFALGKNHAQALINEAEEIVQTGGITLNLWRGEKKGSTPYRLRLNEQEAEGYLNSLKIHFENPLSGTSLAEGMPEELESLLSGNGPPDRYQEITSTEVQEVPTG